MDTHHVERREFLRRMASLGAAGVIVGWRPSLTHSGQAPGESRMKVAYDPAATFELKVGEVEFRRTEKGRPLMARIYQPQGAGPFPTGRGGGRIGWPRNRWTARSRRAVSWWWPST
jgi:hypothetical protein